MDRTAPPQRRLSLVVAAAALVACSACQLSLAVDVDVNRDGGGTLSVVIAADEELLSRAEEAGVDPLAELADGGGALGEGWRRREATDAEGGRSVTLSVPFEDPDQLEALTSDLAEALEADEVDLLDPFSLTVTDDQIEIAAAASAQPTRVVREYGMTRRRAVRLLRRTSAFDYRVSATLPGEVLAAPGAERNDRTVTWTVPPGDAVQVSARSTRPGPPWVRGALRALAGGAVAAVVLWAIRRRRT